jgi:hypothetical protein
VRDRSINQEKNAQKTKSIETCGFEAGNRKKIITNPNENWKKLKREKYMTEKSYFQI